MSRNPTSWTSNGNLCKSKTQTTSRLIHFTLIAPILYFGAFNQLHETDLIMYTVYNKTRGYSSVGRALRLHRRCQRFESV